MENITHIMVGYSRMWQAGLELQVLLWRGVIYVLCNILSRSYYLIILSILPYCLTNANFLMKNLIEKLIKMCCLINISHANVSEYLISC